MALDVGDPFLGLPEIGEVNSEVDCWSDVCCPRIVLGWLVVDSTDGFCVGGGGEGGEVGISEGSEVSMDGGGEVGMVKGGEVNMNEDGEVGLLGMVKGGEVGMVIGGEVNMDEGGEVGGTITGRSPEPSPDSLLGGEGLDASDETLVAGPLGGPNVVRPLWGLVLPVLTGGGKVMILPPDGGPFVGAPPRVLIDECEEGKMDVNVSVLGSDPL